MQYTKGIYIVCSIQREYILYTMYIAFDKIWHNSTKCDKTIKNLSNKVKQEA